MNIGIDARPLISENPSGIGVFLLNILENYEYNPNNQYFLYANDELRCKSKILTRFVVRTVTSKVGTLSTCFGLKKQLLKDEIDVFWGTEHMIPLNYRKGRLVLTVHDIALLKNPKWGTFKNSLMQNIFCRVSIKHADFIMADSIATENDVKTLSKAIPMQVIYPAATDYLQVGSQTTDSVLNVKEKNYFLYVGTLEPRKNIIGIVAAFNDFKEATCSDVQLVLAGKLGWGTEDLKDKVDSSPFKNDIILPGYISESQKKYLLVNAIALVFPSNYEGFGIPVLESMSVGTPVITARNSSLSEVGGKLAYYTEDCADYSKIADLMKICSQLGEQELEKLKLDERKWFNQFSWKKCAGEVKQVLEIW